MKEVIATPNAPQAIGPYAQARTFGNYLFASGQIAIDPQIGEVVAGGIEAQAVQVMENIRQVLLAAEMNFDDVLKTTVFITNMDDFTMVNEAYGRYFSTRLPARSCVEVANLPKGALVEIEVIAASQRK